MTQLIVRKCTLAEVVDAPAFPLLAEAYAFECAMEGMPSPLTKMALYRQLEDAGVLQPFGAFIGDELIGFIGILYHTIPHYGVGVAVSESFFVSPARRASGAGLKLLAMAEEHAKALGSPGLLVSAPNGSALEEVLDGMDSYKLASFAFFKRFT